MFIKNIRIKNFRGISDLSIEGLGQINIFTGENNSGKTSVLEAIFILIGWRVDALFRVNGFRSQKSNVDITYFFNKSISESHIEITALFDENGYERDFEAMLTNNNEGIDNKIALSTLIREKNETTKERITKESLEDFESSDEVKAMKLIGKPLIGNFHCSFPSFRVFEHGNLIKTLSSIITAKEDDKITNFLKPIDERIQGINVVGNGIFLNMDGLSTLLPIEVSGDGVRRILSLILAIYGVGKGGFVMIDEFENGLHYTSMPNFWKAIINTATEMDVQLFITTHNEELLKVLADVVDNELIESKAKIKYYNLKRYENNKSVAYKYDFSKFDFLISNGNEIR